MRAAHKQLDALAGNVTYEVWAWLPSLEGDVRGNYNSNAGFAGTNFYADFIVAATLPLYDHGDRYAKLAEDRAKVVEARAQLTVTRNQAHADWVAARANVTASESVVVAAGTAARGDARNAAPGGELRTAGRGDEPGEALRACRRQRLSSTERRRRRGPGAVADPAGGARGGRGKLATFVLGGN